MKFNDQASIIRCKCYGCGISFTVDNEANKFLEFMSSMLKLTVNKIIDYDLRMNMLAIAMITYTPDRLARDMENDGYLVASCPKCLIGIYEDYLAVMKELKTDVMKSWDKNIANIGKEETENKLEVVNKTYTPLVTYSWPVE